MAPKETKDLRESMVLLQIRSIYAFYVVTRYMSLISRTTMSTTLEVQLVDPIPIPQAPKPPKKLKPARKQVKAGDVVKAEAVQTGKEYST